MVSKSAHDRTGLNLFGRLTGLGQGDHLAEVLMTISVLLDVLAAGVTCRIGSKHAAEVGVARRGRHDTVGGEDDRAIERLELLALLPPGVAIVAHEVLVFLERRIVMRRKHFAVRIDVYACALGLLEQHFHVMHVMSADEDARTLTYTDVHLRHHGVAISRGVRTVEQGHALHAEATRLKHQLRERRSVQIADGHVAQGTLHEGVDRIVLLTEAHGMLYVSGQALETIDSQLLERAHIFVLFTQHTLGKALRLVLVSHRHPCHFVSRISQPDRSSLLFQLIAELEHPIHTATEALLVKVGVRDRGKQGVYNGVIHLTSHRLLQLTQSRGQHTDATHGEQQHIHHGGEIALLSAYTLHCAANTLGRLLALIAKHLVVHLLFFLC